MDLGNSKPMNLFMNKQNLFKNIDFDAIKNELNTNTEQSAVAYEKDYELRHDVVSYEEAIAKEKAKRVRKGYIMYGLISVLIVGGYFAYKKFKK